MKLEYRIKKDQVRNALAAHSLWQPIEVELIYKYAFDYTAYNLRLNGVVYETETPELLAELRIFRIWHKLEK